MSTLEYATAPRSVDVLPSKVSRRVTRRDGLLPLVFALELMAGVIFGLAANSAPAAASSAPAMLTLAPVAQVTVLPSAAPVATVVASTAPAYGPAVGPLRRGTVRPAVSAVVTVVPAYKKHPPRNPFGSLAHS